MKHLRGREFAVAVVSGVAATLAAGAFGLSAPGGDDPAPIELDVGSAQPVAPIPLAPANASATEPTTITPEEPAVTEPSPSPSATDPSPVRTVSPASVASPDDDTAAGAVATTAPDSPDSPVSTASPASIDS